jgi:small subunit ribosomal protein S16
MAVIIRLKRTGKKKTPFYSIVAADSRSPRDGKSLEYIGIYDPKPANVAVKIDDIKLQKWLDCGATISDTVRSLIKTNKKQAVN